MQFVSIVWEILNIFKENFPSKVMLYQENLDLCTPAYMPVTLQEELRR